MAEEKKDILEENVEQETVDTGNTEGNNEVEESTEEKLLKENEALKKEVEELKSAYMRKNAEFQNFTKRKEKELGQLRQFAAEKVIVKVLEAVDNLERAISASAEAKDFDGLVKGVEMTLGQMHNILNAEGVEAIEALGKEFNPELHQAIMVEACEETNDNHVILEVQKGYKMHDKVIRHSMVKVCKK